MVKRYNDYGIEIGYATYWYGKKQGIYINKYQNGLTEDSIFFNLDQKNGFAYSFDSSGRLEVKVNYINDRPVGDSFRYDSTGNIIEYGFTSFEGTYLYFWKLLNNEPYSSGEFLNYKSDTLSVDGQINKYHLFIYLIKPPGIKLSYSIAKVKDRTILSSVPIQSKLMYFEQDLGLLPPGQSYALVASIYNISKGRDDLKVYLLK